MDHELGLRIVFVAAFLGALVLSGYYRARARRSSGVIRRKEEGAAVLLLRLMGALALLIPIAAYALNSDWFGWSRVPAPLGLRWFAALVSILSILFLRWVFVHIRGNISETILIKKGHGLVTTGPYRWIRHPLYTGSLLLLFALGTMAASGLLLGVTSIAMFIFRFLVIPGEERNLISAFGEEYEAYRERSGAMLPRI